MRVELKLSDNFINGEKGDIEVVVLMININYGRNKELLGKCKPLDECSWFVAEIKKNQKETGDLKMAIDSALDNMPDDYLLKPFLMVNRAEVETMCITEYDEQETMESFKEEGREEGIAIGVVKNLVSFIKDGFITEEEAAKRAQISLDEFRKCEALYCS